MKESSHKTKMKKSAIIVAIAAILIVSGIILSVANELGGSGDDFVAGLQGLAMVVLVVFGLMRGKRKRGTAARKTTAAAERAVTRPDPRTASFTKPDAPCIVCENTGEDHLAHDRAARIRQLDVWLKNGIIDRNEYKVLKDRYERDL